MTARTPEREAAAIPLAPATASFNGTVEPFVRWREHGTATPAGLQAKRSLLARRAG